MAFCAAVQLSELLDQVLPGQFCVASHASRSALLEKRFASTCQNCNIPILVETEYDVQVEGDETTKLMVGNN